MKRYLLFPLLCFGTLGAQIELDVVIDEEPSESPITVDAPEERGHGAPKEEAPDTDEVVFLNGDTLVGTLRGIREGMLDWRHPDAEGLIRFETANLKHVVLRTDPGASGELQALARVDLTNGDTLRGEVLGLTNEALELRSPALGTVRVLPRMVRALFPRSVSSALYEGPSSIEEWELNHSNHNWTFREGALYADDGNQVAGIDVEDLPDRYSVNMEIEWKGMLNFQIGFWGKNTMNPNTNSFMISLQNNYMRATRNYNNLGRNTFGNQQVREEMNDGHIVLTLHLDKSAKKFYLFLDETLQGQWADMFDGDIRGDKLLLSSLGNSKIRVSNIRIREWDGELNLAGEEEELPSDRLVTGNGDVFAGEVVRIRDEVLFFQNDFAEFEVPMGRVEEIRFDPGNRMEPRLMAGDVQLITPAKERVTVELESVDEGILQGRSEAMGSVSIKLRYFSELKLNPYDERRNQEAFHW